jgi:hypothetical protein
MVPHKPPRLGPTRAWQTDVETEITSTNGSHEIFSSNTQNKLHTLDMNT